MDASPFLHLILDYRQVASVAWEATRLYAMMEGERNFRSFDDLTEAEKTQETENVTAILADPCFTPEDAHERAVTRDKEAGWRFGYFLDYDKKESPMLVPWDELPLLDRNKEIFFWHTVVGIGIASGKVDSLDLNVKLAARASYECEKFAERLTHGE